MNSMRLLTESSSSSWEPDITSNTTTPSYWLNWRVLICAIFLLMSTAFALFFISKNEGSCRYRHGNREIQEESESVLYEDEVWMPCLKGIHPVWLLGFRLVAFFVLLIFLIVNVNVNGGDIFYFYTQWTFMLVTIYFGLGSLLSIHGCYNLVGINNENVDAEKGTFAANKSRGCLVRKTAGFWGYMFQIVFQMNAGAVILTDCVFWLVIVPFLEIKDYHLNILIINMHSINVVFLVGETFFNSLQFPWFRISYFFLWTTIYVIFQWIVHACVYLWWPYPFLDMSSPYAPLWYLLVALMHIPCFGVFKLVMKMKHKLLSQWFPHSYRFREAISVICIIKQPELN